MVPERSWAGDDTEEQSEREGRVQGSSTGLLPSGKQVRTIVLPYSILIHTNNKFDNQRLQTLARYDAPLYVMTHFSS